MPAANPDQRNKILFSLNPRISREITNPGNKQVLNFESFISVAIASKKIPLKLKVRSYWFDFRLK